MSCSVCTETFFQSLGSNTHIVATKCGHVFHKRCLCDWLETAAGRANRSCPECRKKIGHEPFLRLFLNNPDPDESLKHQLQTQLKKNKENESLIKQLTESAAAASSRNKDGEILDRLKKLQISMDEIKQNRSEAGRNPQGSTQGNQASGSNNNASNYGHNSGQSSSNPGNRNRSQNSSNAGNRNQSQNYSNQQQSGRNSNSGQRNRRGNRSYHDNYDNNYRPYNNNYHYDKYHYDDYNDEYCEDDDYYDDDGYYY